ncbi:MAG: HYR domain-containing protein [Bacteroidetes bacterium]|nr:HYR domain-containing protein [Bacteroidota bacterium]
MFLVLLCTFTVVLNATHYRYGNITWSRTNDATRTVTIKVNQSWRATFFTASPLTVGQVINNTTTLNIGGQISVPVNITVTSYNQAEDWFYGTFTYTYTFTGTATSFQVGYNSNARINNANMQNNNNGQFSAFTQVRLVSGNTGSPISSMPPIIAVPTGQSAFQFNVTAADPDGGSLTFLKPTTTTSPTGASLFGTGWVNASQFSLTSSGVGTFNSTGLTIGHLYNCGVLVTDATGSTTTLDFLVQIVAANTPPIFDYTITPADNSSFSLNPGASLSLTFKATCPDAGSTVALSAVGLPTSNISFSPGLPTSAANPVSTTMTFTPTNSNLGVYVVTFTATRNGGVQTTTSVSINVNTNPFFIDPSPIEGGTYIIPTGSVHKDTLTATNPDVNVTTRMESATYPSGASLDKSLPTSYAQYPSVVMNWTPTAADYGIHTVSFTAKDGNGRTATRTYYLAPNTLPAFTSSPVETGHELVTYTYNITAEDDDVPYGDEIHIDATGLPSWLTLTDNGDGTATLTGTPGIGDAGTYHIHLHVADIYHHAMGHDEQEIELVIDACDVAITHTVTPTSCPASSDGSIEVEVTSNGTSSSVEWGGGETTTTLSGLVAGDYTVTATDNFGCTSTETITVTATPDITAPTVITQNITVTLSNTGSASIGTADIDNGSSDACGIASMSLDKTSFSCSDLGNQTVTLTVTDVNGNSSTGTATVTVKDVTAPASVTLSDLTDECEVTATAPTTSDACSGTITGTTTDPLYYAAQGSYVIHWTFTDGSGNSTTANQNVIISDATDPVIVCPDDIEVGNDNGSCGASVTVSQPSVSDNCTSNFTGATELVSNGGFSSGATGWNACSNAVEAYCTEQCYGSSSTNQVAEVDVQVSLCQTLSGLTPGKAYVLSFKASRRSTGGTPNPIRMNVAVSGGALSTTVTRTNTTFGLTPESFIFIANSSSHTISFTPGSGNTSTLGMIVDDISVKEKTGTLTNSYTGTSNASGNYPVGTTTVTWTATDAAGNSSTCTQNVTVKDTEKPVITCPAAATVSCDADHTSASTGVATATDNCTTSPTITQSDASTQDADDTKYAHYNYTITRTWTATDAKGNSSSCDQVITVQDVTAPTAACKSISIDLSATGAASITAADINNGSNDNCDPNVSISASQTSFDCSDVGDQTVTLTVTDASGNSSTCDATVTVNDVTAPVVATQNISVNLNSSGTASITASQIDNGSSDACGIASMSLDNSSFTCANVGSNNTVTLTVTDVNGNSSTGTATVTVIDEVAPVVVTQTVTVTLSGGTASVTAAQVDNGSSDACGIAGMSLSKTSFDCSNIGNNTVTLTVTDVNGNIASNTATVVVVGTIPTVSVAQSNLAPFCQGGKIVLTASANEAVTYAWSNSATNNPTQVDASGTYSVTVTNSNGCTASASTTVVYSQTDLLSSYTIIGAADEVEIEKYSKVETGGVASLGRCNSKNSEIEVEDNSTITGSTTFAKAKKIEVKGGSSVTNAYSGSVPTLTLPVFRANPYCDDKKCKHDRCDHKGCGKKDCKHDNCNHGKDDVKVKKGTTVTLTDSVYAKIHIESDATVTFTNPVVYCDQFETQEGATVKFSGCTKMSVCKEFKLHEGNSFNPDAKGVVVYAEGKIDIKKGTTVVSNFYGLEDFDTKADKNKRNSITGLVIADKVHAHYTTFNWNTNCTNCNSLLNRAGTDENQADNLRENGKTFFSVFPNPSEGNFRMTLNGNLSGALNVTVYNSTGMVVYTHTAKDFTGLYELPIDLTRNGGGVYIVRATVGEQVFTQRIQNIR